MFSTDDTIVAIATPPGRGGIGVVRLSGPRPPTSRAALLRLDAPLQPRHATFARTHGDQVVATYFPAPHSYTGERRRRDQRAWQPGRASADRRGRDGAGARLAEPGEFTLRAFLNGRIDLVQAEAVADLIDAVTPLQARAAFDQLEGTLTDRIAEIDAELFDLTARLEASLDFPDEGYHFVDAGEAAAALAGDRTTRSATLLCDARRGRLIREGARVAIAGKPNVGKSSLFNALLRAGRAIVTPVPGTTRDLVTETADVDGLRLELIDTAGVRDTTDEVELEGVARARRAWTTADLVLVVLDRVMPARRRGCRAAERNGRAAAPCRREQIRSAGGVELRRDRRASRDRVSEDRRRAGRASREIRSALDGANPATARDTAAVTNVRHAALLERARAALRRAGDAMEAPGGPVAEEFVLTDLQDARAALEEVTGKRTSEDLLRHIFARFCIGK